MERVGCRNDHELDIWIGHKLGEVRVTARNCMRLTNRREYIRLFPADGSYYRVRMRGERLDESPANTETDNAHL